MSPRLVFFLILSLCLESPLQASERFVRTQLLMGDVAVSITIESKPSRKTSASAAMETAFREAHRLESALSEWRPESETTRLNQKAGKAPIAIGHELMELLEQAQAVSKLTEGGFDITFASKNKTRSYRDVILQPESGRAELRAGVKISVSSIAKGIIVDRMAAVLRTAGFRKFLINAGDLYAAGRWTVGLRDPSAAGSGETRCQISIKDQAVSTSGQYERSGHIIDPKTRRPVPAAGSVTVIAKTSSFASPLATGLFVLGVEKSKQVLMETPDTAALFITKDGKQQTFNLSPRYRCRCRPSWRSTVSNRGRGLFSRQGSTS